METVRTTCNRDCPDACSILVDVERGRALRLRGDPDHPITRGFLCARTNRFLERQYAADRLTTPLIKKDGELRPTSWDEALDLVASKLAAIRRESGPAAVLHYRSGGSLGLLKPLSDFLFERWGPVTIQRGDICSGAGEAAQRADFGDCDSNEIDDLANARTIVLWGKNPYVSSPHLLPILREAKARGTKLVLIDPAHHRTADLCDLALRPAPGSDAAVALATARVMFERGTADPRAEKYVENLEAFRSLCFSRTVKDWARRADLTVADIETFADLYREGPSAILVGWGMGRRVNGASIVRAVDALATISGNMGRAGGGSLFYWKRRGAFDLSFIRGAEVAPRTLPEPLLGPAILEARDPEIRAAWITCANPVAMLPDSAAVERALATRELVVVVDSHFTDTARLATVVLPATTMLEDDDVLGAYGHHWLSVATPAIAPPDGVKTDLQILQALAARLGVGDALAGDARAWKRRLLEPLERQTGTGLDQIERERWTKNPRAKRVLFEGNRFATESGKARLIESLPETAERDPGRALTLLSISTDKAQASQWSARSQEGPAEVTLHPDAAPGLKDGDRAVLSTRLGTMDVIVRLDGRQRRDVVIVPKGGWHSRGRSANALVSARLTDLGEGAAYYDEPARIDPEVGA